MIIAAVVLLAACSRPVSVPAVDKPVDASQLPVTASAATVAAAVSDQPLPQAVEASSDVLQGPILAAQESLQEAIAADPLPAVVVEPADAACRRAAASLIIRFEVTSEAYYNRRLLMPIWPKGQSGITWGIGYDGGHQTTATILDDWREHEGKQRLSTTAGVTGNEAGQVLTRYRDILTPFSYAGRVFEERSLIEYHRRTERAFRDGFADISPLACAALVDLVYNRGSSMTGDSRREMRVLRDECVPAHDYACMAREIRSMKRLWHGTVNEAGLSARREAEAQLTERR